MRIHFYSGPDKVPFRLLENRMVECPSAIPFHGIISRGLMNRLIANHVDVSAYYLFMKEQQKGLTDPGELECIEIYNYYKNCKVLSFGESAAAAMLYVLHYCSQHMREGDIEIWNLKEGHTSSVWKVSIFTGTDEEFILNVARDEESADELRITSEKLRAIGDAYPELNVARVLDIQVLCDATLPFPVLVTRNEWVDNSYEIHARRSRDKDEEELLMVERFLNGEDHSAFIGAVRGRVFTNEETGKIWTDINDFIKKAAAQLPQPPTINIKEGDVVWNGERAVIVAIS